MRYSAAIMQQMRYLSFLLSAVLIAGCGSKNASPEALPEAIQKTGIIVTKEEVSLEDIEKSDSRVRTSIYASIFSGGRISLGLGFLFSPSGSDDKSETPIRYEVKMLDGSELILYSESKDFEIDDCVDVTISEDVDKHPPIMQRNKDGC